MTVVEDGDGDGNDADLPHPLVEAMQCSFTVADALIARTGSIVLRATTAGGRRLSVLPPIHCVVAERAQLVPYLSAWLNNVHSDRGWSYGTIITGPSRTADIERILVLGAHGPKRLIVIVVDQIN
jgi:L-lactate dehydrogenase complex protein LldG